MITIKLADFETLKKLEISHNAYICCSNDDISGFCEFEIKDNILNIIAVKCEDRQLTDGMIRQTMNYCLDKGCEKCIFSDDVKQEMISLHIIKNEDESQINILDFFKKINF